MKKTGTLCFVLLLIVLGGCSSSDKPSRKEVVDNFVKISMLGEKDMSKSDEKELKKSYECIVDKAYDKVSSKTLKRIIKAKTVEDAVKVQKEVSKKDYDSLTKASTDCAPKLESAKKSNAKTTLRNAMSTVVAMQAGLGVTDYYGITIDNLNKADPDSQYVYILDDESTENQVGMINRKAGVLILQTRSNDLGICYFAKLSSDAPTQYGYAKVVDTELCPTDPDKGYFDRSDDGWRVSD